MIKNEDDRFAKPLHFLSLGVNQPFNICPYVWWLGALCQVPYSHYLVPGGIPSTAGICSPEELTWMLKRIMPTNTVLTDAPYTADPSATRGLRGAAPPCSRKSLYQLWLLGNLTTNSLLVTGRLSDNINSRLAYILYVICIYNYYIIVLYK